MNLKSCFVDSFLSLPTSLDFLFSAWFLKHLKHPLVSNVSVLMM